MSAVGRGVDAQLVRVPGLAVLHLARADRVAALRQVFVAHEHLEEDERRVDRLEHALELGEQRRALVGGHRRRQRRERLAQRVAQPAPRGADLRGNLHHRHLRRHDALRHAGAHHLLGRKQHARHAEQPLEVRLVVVERGEGRQLAHLGDLLVRSVPAADRHHPRVEAEAVDRQREVAHEQRVVKRVLGRELGRIDLAQRAEQDGDLRVAPVDARERDIGEFARAVLDAASEGVLGVDGQPELVVALDERVEPLRGALVVGPGVVWGGGGGHAGGRRQRRGGRRQDREPG